MNLSIREDDLLEWSEQYAIFNVQCINFEKKDICFFKSIWKSFTILLLFGKWLFELCSNKKRIKKQELKPLEPLEP